MNLKTKILLGVLLALAGYSWIGANLWVFSVNEHANLPGMAGELARHSVGVTFLTGWIIILTVLVYGIYHRVIK